MSKHWSEVEYLHQTVQNPNIVIRGTHSYYSNAWTPDFEDYVVRYLYGDKISSQKWQPQWELDKLYIGDYVCIGAETVILMGGNNTHRTDWFSDYPFLDDVLRSYRQKGDTRIGDGVWIGMRSVILPGISIGEGAVVAAGSIVVKDVAPYEVVGGNPAHTLRKRFDDTIIKSLLEMRIYELPEDKFERLRPFLSNNDFSALEQAFQKLP